MEKKEEEKIIEYKICLLGDSSVGKTAIFKKISSGEFSDSISTLGIDKKTINYKDIEINIKGNIVKKSFDISLFDTAGQERFRAMTVNYIKGSDGIILIYDICNRVSFENIGNWLNSIKGILSSWKDSNSNYLIMLIGNKSDKVEDSPKAREVAAEEGKKKSEEYDIYWGGECSAITFTDIQLKELFGNLIIDLYKKKGNQSNDNKKIELFPNEQTQDQKKRKRKKKCC